MYSIAKEYKNNFGLIPITGIIILKDNKKNFIRSSYKHINKNNCLDEIDSSHNTIAIIPKHNNIVVLDIDDVDEWIQFKNKYNILEPNTVQERTRKGFHYYFKTSKSITKNIIKIKNFNIDIIYNTLIFMTPTKYDNVEYAWIDNHELGKIDMQEVPEWVLELYKPDIIVPELNNEIISESSKNKINIYSNDLSLDEIIKIIPRSETYQDWLYNGFAIVDYCKNKSISKGEGLSHYKNHSKLNIKKYNDDDTEKQWDVCWDNYNGDDEKRITMASLYGKVKNTRITTETKNYIKEEINDDALSNITIDKELIKGNSEFEALKMIIRCTCEGNNIEHNLQSDGYYFYCTRCFKRFPEETKKMIPFKYKNLCKFLNINITINNITNNTTINNNQDEFIGLTQDDTDEMLTMFEDAEYNKLLVDLIDIYNTEGLLNVIKYLDELDGSKYIYGGEQEHKHNWFTWLDGSWKKTNNPNMFIEYNKIRGDLKNIIKNKNINQYVNKIIKKIITSLGSMDTKNNVTAMWKLMHIDEKFEDYIDSKEYLIGFVNCGVYDLKEKCFRTQRKDDYITMSVGYEFKPEGDGKRDEVLKFFEDIQPNYNDREFLLKTLASCLFGVNKEERLGIHTGMTRNGKGALTELLKHTLGEYIGLSTGTFIQSERPSSTQPQPDLISMKNKRLLIINEIDDKKNLNLQFVKNLIGNDTINCRALYSNRELEFKAQFKMILMCNDRPPLDSDRRDIWSKIYILKYPIEFVDSDPKENQRLKDVTLKEKMKDWKYDMMNILIEYYYKYLDEGLDYSENIMKAITNERSDNDPIGEFISENIELIDVSDSNLSFANRYKLPLTEIIDCYISKNKIRISNKERQKLKEQFTSRLGEAYNHQRALYYFNYKFI